MLPKQDMSNSSLLQSWDTILNEQADSGLTKKAFCEQRGFNVATFYYWQRRLRVSQEQSSGGFQRVLPAREHELTVCILGHEVTLRSSSVLTLAQVVKELLDA